jgi:hypothetical protein
MQIARRRRLKDGLVQNQLRLALCSAKVTVTTVS